MNDLALVLAYGIKTTKKFMLEHYDENKCLEVEVIVTDAAADDPDVIIGFEVLRISDDDDKKISRPFRLRDFALTSSTNAARIQRQELIKKALKGTPLWDEEELDYYLFLERG